MKATHLGHMMLPSLSSIAPNDLLTMARSLDAESLARVIALRDWLVTAAGQMEDPNEVLSGFLNQLIDLPQQGRRAVVMVTHDPQSAAFADRLVRIRDGLLESDPH